MKKILFLLIVASPLFALGQQNPKFVYCEIVGQAKLFSTKVTVVVDFGEKLNYWADKRLMDEATGKPIVFNSMVDALNFMGKQGWQFSQAYTIGNAQNGYVYHFLMAKLFEDLDDEAKKEFLKN